MCCAGALADAVKHLIVSGLVGPTECACALRNLSQCDPAVRPSAGQGGDLRQPRRAPGAADAVPPGHDAALAIPTMTAAWRSARSALGRPAPGRRPPTSSPRQLRSRIARGSFAPLGHRGRPGTRDTAVEAALRLRHHPHDRYPARSPRCGAGTRRARSRRPPLERRGRTATRSAGPQRRSRSISPSRPARCTRPRTSCRPARSSGSSSR